MEEEKKAEAPQSDRRRKGGPTKGRRRGRGQERKRGGGEGTLQRSHRVRSSTEVEHQERALI
ncbi:hypothetical protein MUP77_04990 [Candidatus Bathyarchaeota archaeon]|nr:hypothetical protein [Candidatus Bathyarchaeota archaeon]